MAASIPSPSSAVMDARANRATAVVDWDWYTKKVSSNLELGLEKRLAIVAQILQSSVVQYISAPVTKGTGPRGGAVVMNRSRPGQFPKADTGNLKNTIFSGVHKESGIMFAFVGHPTDYGVILETKMARQLLVETLYRRAENIRTILTRPNMA